MMAGKPQQILLWISSLIGAVSCWWMAHAIYRAYRSGQQQVFGIPIIAIYILEFILVHAGSIPMIAASKESKSAKIFSISLVSTIYVTFIAAATVELHNAQLLLTFAGIMIPRWTGLFTDSDAARQQQINRSLESTLAFVFTIIPIVLLLESPNALVFGLIAYFAVMGLLEGTSPLRKRRLEQSQRAGCIIGAATFIIVIIIVGGSVVKMVWESIGSYYHK
jgi:uncharacterized Tic20 family protein